MMKRKPVEPKIPKNQLEAQKYAKSSEKRGKRMGKDFAVGLKRIGFEKGRILDAGCGSGEVAIELAAAFPEAEVVGADLSEPLLEMARKSAADLFHNLSFEREDVQALSFEDDSFDIVVSVNMLHVVDDPVAMLNEIERVLKPTGILGLGDNKRSWAGYFVPALKSAYTAEEAKDILQKSNLREWEFTEAFFWFSLKAGGKRNRNAYHT
jgi:ubiquinone/menaquinone biosynthesis C-methylase UbiE